MARRNYHDHDYTSQRLSGTIIRLGAEPVTVIGVDHESDSQNIRVSIRSLKPRSSSTNARLKDLDLTPVPLGFAITKNTGGTYLARIPKRSDYRQGLRDSNYGSLLGPDHRRVTKYELRKTILGIHSDFEFAMEELENTPDELSRDQFFLPFARDWAVYKSGKRAVLAHKWMANVGDIVKDRPLLHPNLNYLQESLELAL